MDAPKTYNKQNKLLLLCRIYSRKFVVGFIGFLSELPDTIYKFWLRNNIQTNDFTIISSDCWGGSVYEDLNILYLTPTVGLFFFPDCYLKFVSDLRSNLNKELQFTEHSKYEKAREIRKNKYYPIAKIGDIEIHFLHYKSEKEALEKWNRRKERVNLNKIFLVFNDDEGCTYEHLKRFDCLDYPKIAFTVKRYPELKSTVFLKHLRNQETVGDIYTNRWHTRRYFNLVKWLNSTY